MFLLLNTKGTQVGCFSLLLATGSSSVICKVEIHVGLLSLQIQKVRRSKETDLYVASS